jgi:hypothetical protein
MSTIGAASFADSAARSAPGTNRKMEMSTKTTDIKDSCV